MLERDVSMDKRVKVGIAGLMIGSVLLLTGCNLKHDEREGTMLNNPSIVEPAQNADIPFPAYQLAPDGLWLAHAVQLNWLVPRIYSPLGE